MQSTRKNPQTKVDIPLALYIHIPWCIKKCPYCDFNSHAISDTTDFAGYVDALIADAQNQRKHLARFLDTPARTVSSVFFGGGTPSLLPTAELTRLLVALKSMFLFAKDCEITLEANPGTLEHAPFSEYLGAGINRLSVGVQSFSNAHLRRLGRVHNAAQAQAALRAAKAAGFTRLNVDLMHGIVKQTRDEAMHDLYTAIGCGATHVSWYQLTIEPNTYFYQNTPKLPDEEALAGIQDAGEAVLKRYGLTQYEVSAWVSECDAPCVHNLNYWQFGDYLGLGAGAHGKVSLLDESGQVRQVFRYAKSRLPKDYLKAAGKLIGFSPIAQDELPFEFMMNALRLSAGVPAHTYAQKTGLDLHRLNAKLNQLRARGLLKNTKNTLVCTELGRRYLNQVLSEFSSLGY